MPVDLPPALRRRLDPEARYGLRLTLAAAAVVLVAVPFSYLVFEVLAKGPLTRFDGRAADALNARVHDAPGLVRFLEAVSWFGRPPVLIAFVALAALFVWRRGSRRLAIFLVATTVAGGAVDTIVKLVVDRPRPAVDHPVATALGKSFPSGHAMSSTVAYGALLLVFLPAIPQRARRATLVGTVVLVLAIGCSRLLLGVHFVTDVVGGFVLGLAWLAAATAVFETWRTEEGRRPSAPLTEGVEPEAGPAMAAPEPPA